MKLCEAYIKLQSADRSKVEYYDDSNVVHGLCLTPAQIAKQYMRGGDLPSALQSLPSEEQFVARVAPRDLGEAMQEAHDFVNSVSAANSMSQQQNVENNPVSAPPVDSTSETVQS